MLDDFGSDDGNGSDSDEGFVPSLDSLMGNDTPAGGDAGKVIVKVMRQGKSGEQCLTVNTPASIKDVMHTLDWDFTGHSFMIQNVGAGSTSFSSITSPNSYRFSGEGSGDVDYFLLVTPRVSGGMEDYMGDFWESVIKFFKS